MRGFDERRDGLFSYVRPESRIPKNHPLRVIRTLADEALAVLDAQFAELYSQNGCPSAQHAEIGTPSRFKPAGHHARNRHPVTLEFGTGSRGNPARLPKAPGHSAQRGLCCPIESTWT
jgi:hypothetical protein